MVWGAGRQWRPLGCGLGTGSRACANLSPWPVATQGLLYAASYSGVVQVPLANCSLYQSCGDCLLARDPYCAWNGSSCNHISLHKPELDSR